MAILIFKNINVRVVHVQLSALINCSLLQSIREEINIGGTSK